jgi:hypothetical protein
MVARDGEFVLLPGSELVLPAGSHLEHCLPFAGLELQRRPGQWLRIGPDIYVGVARVEGQKKAYLRVLAPEQLVIARGELIAE